MRIFSSNEFGKRRPSPPPPPRKRQRKHLHRKRREKRERGTRASFAIEKGLVRPTTTTTHESSKIAREREKIFEFFAQQRREEVSATMRNGVKTSARTTLLPPLLLPGKLKVDFRAGFFSTSSSANRFGVGARRALFLSLMMMLFRFAARQQSCALLSFVQFPFLVRFFS